ncbi:MAG: T9SS type A sorting domain-containing protein [Saprospiraceae bacterium]
MNLQTKIKITSIYFALLITICSLNKGNTQDLNIHGEFPNNNLKWPFIYDLKILNNDELLCSTEKGQIFNKKMGVWDVISVPDINSASIRGVVKDHEGNLWAATAGQGISRLKNGQWENYKKGTNNLPTDNWKCAAIDNSGNLWFGSWTDGVIKYDGSTWKLFTQSSTPTSGLASDGATGIFIDKTNKVWVYADGDITVLNGNSIKKYDLDNLVDFGIRVNAICQDKNGLYYLATSKGIVTFNGTNFINEKEKFGNFEVGAINIDKSNVLWYCETNKGIHRWDNGKKNYFEGTVDNLIPSQTFKIVIDSLNRKLMIGNKGSQVIFIDDSEFLSATDDNSNINTLHIGIFPNPTHGLINFENLNGHLYDVSISNLVGNQFKETISENTINLTQYNSGVYIIRLTDTDGRKSRNIKVIKI